MSTRWFTQSLSHNLPVPPRFRGRQNPQKTHSKQQQQKQKKKTAKEKAEKVMVETVLPIPDWVDVWGTFFKEDDPMTPTDDIKHFVQDLKRQQYLNIFKELEDGQIVDDKEFITWLHPEFKDKYMTYDAENDTYAVNLSFTKQIVLYD